MMYPSSSVVRGAVALGAAASLFAAFVGYRLLSNRQSELQRFADCSAGTRTDCEPSLFWVLSGLAENDGAGQLQPVTTFAGAASQKRVVRTSDDAPILTSIKPDGFTPEGQGYGVRVGTPVTLTVKVENAKQVEVRFLPAGTKESERIAELSPVQGQEFTYSAALSWAETRAGDLEILALGTKEGERTQMFLPLRIEAVAEKR